MISAVAKPFPMRRSEIPYAIAATGANKPAAINAVANVLNNEAISFVRSL